MVNPKKRSQAVARIIAGESTVEAEAARLSTHSRTVEKWVSRARKAGAAKTEPPAGVPLSAVSTPSNDAEESNPALEAARAAVAGDAAGKPNAAPTAADLAGGREDMARFCLDTIGQLKMAVGGALVTFKYSPPLDVASPKVQSAIALGPVASTAIRANAEKLYPTLVKLMSGPFVVYGALAIDALMMIMALHGLATSEGWVPKEKAPPSPPPGKPPAPAAAQERKPFAGVKGYRPQDLGPEIDRARREMKVTPRPQGDLPDTSTPTTGTINAAPAAA